MKINSYSVINCQICNSEQLESVLFVGFIPPVNTMMNIGERLTEQEFFPLELLRCKECNLVQVGYIVDQSILFPASYPYRSASTKILHENFENLSSEVSTLVGFNKGGLVIDIGSNDGTLLSKFRDSGMNLLGIEPSDAAQVANENGINSIQSYFNMECSENVVDQYGAADVITATNVFAHIDDVHSIVKAIINSLKPNGVFISESHYLLGLVETLQYDTIYHEHLRYYSLKSLMNLFKMHNLDIFHVSRIPTHGGSIRVYACRAGEREIDKSVADLLQVEEKSGLLSGSIYTEFREKVIRSKLSLYHILDDIKSSNAKVYGVGAPSRASTLINYLGLDNGVLDCVVEISSSPKVGKYIPGTRIPVLDEKQLYDQKPEYALLLSWHIADELISNLRAKGYTGKFIVPLPTPTIID